MTAKPKKPTITDFEQMIAHLRVTGADRLAEDLEDRIGDFLPKWYVNGRTRSRSFSGVSRDVAS